MDNFQIRKEIGAGSFANVFQALNIENNEIVAIKRLKQKYSTMDEVLNLREVKFMRKIQHQNIIKMKEIIKVQNELNLVFEYFQQNLLQYYQQSQLQEKQIKSIIYQCAQGLSYMHLNGYFHRDLKPENILISNGIVKLCDFGLAREIRPPYTEYVATRWYRAPEIILRSINYNSPVDIFALGCIMAELYNSQSLLKGISDIDQLIKTLQLMGTPSQSKWQEGYRLAMQAGIQMPQFEGKKIQLNNASQDAINLVTEMLQIDPQNRPSANKILQHKYFDEVRGDSHQIINNERRKHNQQIENNKIYTQREQKRNQIQKINNEFNNKSHLDDVQKEYKKNDQQPTESQEEKNRQFSLHTNGQYYQQQTYFKQGLFENMTNRNAHRNQNNSLNKNQQNKNQSYQYKNINQYLMN